MNRSHLFIISVLGLLLIEVSFAKGKAKKKERNIKLSTESYFADVEGFYNNFLASEAHRSEYVFVNDGISAEWQIQKAVYQVKMDVSVLNEIEGQAQNFKSLYDGIVELTPASNLVRGMPFNHKTSCDVKSANSIERDTNIYHHSLLFNVHVEYGINNHNNKYAALECLRRYFRSL